MRIPFWRFLILSVALAAAGRLPAQAPRPHAVPPELVLVQDEANLRLKAELDRRYDALRARGPEWQRRARGFNATYVGHDFPAESPMAAAAATESAWLTRERSELDRDVQRFNDEIWTLRIERAAVIREMTALARRLPNWNEAEVARVGRLMNEVRREGDSAASLVDIAGVWDIIRARDGDAAFAALAAAGIGPDLRSLGPQSFEDCSIYALAAASGQPYGFVAALAGEVTRGNTTRGQADRDDPEGLIKRHGLNTYDVILMAEALGEPVLVRSEAFVDTLRAGNPVMVTVRTVRGSFPALSPGRHAMVLSRTFEHEGQPWFEVIDSNLGVNVRHYVSEGELFTMLAENGIAYRPELLPLARP